MYIIRIALDDGGGKWAPGTVLGAYPLDMWPRRFGPADIAGFHLVRIKTNKYSLDELKSMIGKRVLDLTELLSPEELIAKIEQKEAIHVERCARVSSLLDSQGRMMTNFKIVVGDVGYKPDMSKLGEVDFDMLTLKDADPKYTAKPAEQPAITMPTEEEMRRFGK